MTGPEGLLTGRTAVLYGAGGPIGRAVARAYAAHGARLYLSGRTLAPLEELAGELPADVHVARVDALDEAEVDRYVRTVVDDTGSLDISFNLIGVGDVQGTPVVDMSLEDFERPVRNAVRTQFLTCRAAARQMVEQRSGVILTFGGGGGRDPVPGYAIGGFAVAMRAVDAFRRQLASELGPYGVRVVTLESGGVVEAIPAGYPDRDAVVDMVVGATLLRRAATYEDVGNAAVFAASAMAGAVTGSTINITAGTTTD